MRDRSSGGTCPAADLQFLGIGLGDATARLPARTQSYRGRRERESRIAPDSGTEELSGIAGTFRIEIVDGKHLYEVDYSLPQ